MARTAVTVTELTPTAALADPAGTNADATNDHSISGVPLEELLVRISCTASSTHDATIKAGDNPPALEAGQGDISATFGDGSTTPVVKWFGPFTSARFAQSDGSLEIDLASGFTGKVTAFHVPRSA